MIRQAVLLFSISLMCFNPALADETVELSEDVQNLLLEFESPAVIAQPKPTVILSYGTFGSYCNYQTDCPIGALCAWPTRESDIGPIKKQRCYCDNKEGCTKRKEYNYE